MIQTFPVNFIVPVGLDNGREAKVFIPQPLEKDIMKISRVLSYIFNQTQNTPLQILLIDWERFVEESLYTLPQENANYVKNLLEGVLDKCVSAGECDIKDIHSFSQHEMTLLKGGVVFISALFRYVYCQGQTNSEIEQFFTSLKLTEWRASLSNSSKPSPTESPKIDIVAKQ